MSYLQLSGYICLDHCSFHCSAGLRDGSIHVWIHSRGSRHTQRAHIVSCWEHVPVRISFVVVHNMNLIVLTDGSM